MILSGLVISTVSTVALLLEMAIQAIFVTKRHKCFALLPHVYQVGILTLHSPSNFNTPSSNYLPYHAWFTLPMVLLQWKVMEKSIPLHNICLVLCATRVKTGKLTTTDNSVSLVTDMVILDITYVTSYEK